ncbi:MAG: hypothetical protein ACREBH_02245 [Candidatus Micrarchaeaceae archaeon]
MAGEKKVRKDETKAKKVRRKHRSIGGAVAYAVAIIIVVAVIAIAIFASGILNDIGGGQGPSSSFIAFKHNFDTAPRVDIFVAAYNGTVLSSTIGCATAVIEEVVGSKTNHRNASTIDLNIVNQTSCIRTRGLGGNVTANYTVESLQNCLNTSSHEPTLYINYSTKNKTVISPEYMYVSGSVIFLRECGIASQIS